LGGCSGYVGGMVMVTSQRPPGNEAVVSIGGE
jgi:hypothetical protein